MNVREGKITNKWETYEKTEMERNGGNERRGKERIKRKGEIREGWSLKREIEQRI